MHRLTLAFTGHLGYMYPVSMGLLYVEFFCMISHEAMVKLIPNLYRYIGEVLRWVE